MGGLGNRIINLVSSMFISRVLDCELYVYWRPCHLCDCEFNDVFDVTSINLIASDTEYMQLAKHSDLILNNITLKTTDTIFKRDIGISINMHLATQDVLKTKRLIVNKSISLPSFITVDDIVDMLGIFIFKKEIYREAYRFISENNINYNDIGYHGRFTDCYNRDKQYRERNTTNKQILIDTISSNVGVRYFVCSCEREFEGTLINYKNAVYRRKEHYPVFYDTYEALLNTSPAYIQRLITEYTQFPLNYISKEAVIDGIVDMLILSRTTMIKAISSTFWDLASWYSHVFISEKYIKVNKRFILL